jgi:hypothetical protein
MSRYYFIQIGNSMEGVLANSRQCQWLASGVKLWKGEQRIDLDSFIS